MQKQLNLILNGKGGVGKSFFATNFVQYLKDKNINYIACDCDNENSTLKRFHGDDVVFLDLSNPHGLDVMIGTYTEILGYEVYETGNNPNYTRSYGYAIEPTAMTGILLGYQLTSAVALNAGICDAWSAGVNARSNPPKSESFKTYMGSVTFTCPTNFGFLSGSTLSGGAINGFDAGTGADKTSLYIGGTVNTPITGVKVGAAYDYAMLGPNNFPNMPRTLAVS